MSSTDVLVVSENPALIHHAFKTLRSAGLNVIGCLGPAHTRCPLEEGKECPLAAHSRVVVVDSPASGSFTDHLKCVPAASYAAALAERHPETVPILCGAPESSAGPTGSTAQGPGVISTIEILRLMGEVSHLSDDLCATSS